MGVNLRGLHILVAHQFLDHADGHPVLQQMRCIAVAQRNSTKKKPWTVYAPKAKR